MGTMNDDSKNSAYIASTDFSQNTKYAELNIIPGKART
jgi:hypothetical protein